MNSFIATLATMMVYRGIAMVLSQGQPISTFPNLFFFELLGRSKLFGSLPVPVVWLGVWGVLLYVLLHRTSYGVKVLATGDNLQAADLPASAQGGSSVSISSLRLWRPGLPASSQWAI